MNVPAKKMESDAIEQAPNTNALALVEYDEADDKAAQDNIFDFLASYTATQKPHPALPDTIDERYALQLSEPLPEFDSTLAKAYAIVDQKEKSRKLFGLVCGSHYSIRVRIMDVLKNLKHPNLMELITYGITEISSLSEYRLVIIFERPKGRKLSEVLAERKMAFPDRVLAQEVIAPLVQIMKLLHTQGITHGRINLDNIYLSDKIVLGECVSEPMGYSQNFIAEPPELLFALPEGKGYGTPAADCYATGVLAMALSLGGPPYEGERDAYIDQMVMLGAYNTLTAKRNFSDYLQDLLRGTLIDNPLERWDYTYIEQWLTGKRYNLIHPSIPKEAPRPFEFEGTLHFNLRSLAHGLFKHWDAAKTSLRDNKLSRWMELSVHKVEMAEAINKIIKSTGGEHNRNDKHNQEFIARLCLLLDPYGSMRLNKMALNIDGIGPMLAHCYRLADMKAAATVVDIIDFDLPNFVSDLQRQQNSNEVSTVLWKLQKTRIFMRINSLGFGLERALYDLNPHLPCQSPLVAGFNIMSLQQMLLALNMIAKDKARTHPPIDKHIACFIASKLDLSKEVKVLEFQRFPNLRSHPDLCMLKLLGQAQEKAGRIKLPGLSAWVGLRILNLMEDIHNRQIRHELEDKLKKAARTGMLGAIAQIIIDVEMAKTDYLGFMQAAYRYNKNAQRVEELRDSNKLAERSERFGQSLSIWLSSIIFLMTVYYTVKSYIMW